ncbi:MAG: hypothetical protein H8E44_40770 [Planctomycetes bacterium]|nr:hypothetical protein [Planctomycetota bacterium]
MRTKSVAFEETADDIPAANQPAATTRPEVADEVITLIQAVLRHGFP